MYRQRHQQPAPRRGIVLLVVLALLTLFAIVGISFVLYANSEANSSRYYRESEAPPQADMDPELLISMFLGQLIYGVDDDTGIYSALRGHDLARNMYGYYYPRPNTKDANFPNINAFNGTGRLRGGAWPPTWPRPVSTPDGAVYDDSYQPNYQLLDPTYIHDPERPGWRKITDPKLPYLGGFNPPYTYPDLNNMFLAAVKAGPLELPGLNPNPYPGSAGAVLIQSFHRPWLFGSLDPSNPNWTTDYGKYMILRPRTKENPGFPYPEDLGGDVKNLINSPGFFLGVDPTTHKPKFANNDSIWIDLGAPVMTAPDGTKFKPLFAPLIVDLDNRINVNVHGNIRGRGASHVSNQGWGPWEVNVNRVLNYAPQPNEWSHLLTDLSSGNTPVESGRYTDNAFGNIPIAPPPTNNVAPSGQYPHYWGPVDFDACNRKGGPSDKLNPYTLAFQNPVTVWYCPSFPSVPNGYDNGQDPPERTNHPLVYNFFNPYQDPGNPLRHNLVFPISNMEALLRYGETNSPGLTSSLFRLCALNFADPVDGAKRRGLVTTHSFGLDRPGVSPWWWYNGDPGSLLSVNEYNFNPNAVPSFPTANPVAPPPLNVPPQQLRDSDFQTAAKTFQSDWRTLNAALAKLDLNRKLTPYPFAQAKRNPALPFNLPYPGNANATTNPVIPFDLPTNPAAVIQQAAQAREDRKQFAQDILLRLMIATGAYNPQAPPLDATGAVIAPTDGQVRAVQYLAQLAVNIVDFIDSDDIMTGLDWLSFVAPSTQKSAKKFLTAATKLGYTGKNQFVWGTELPRVLLNEVYGEYTLVSGNPDMGNAVFQVDLWAELYNPLSPDAEAADPTKGVALLQVPGEAANRAAYRLELYNPVKTASNPIPNVINQSNNPTGEATETPTGGVALTQLFTNPQGSPCQTAQFTPVPAAAGNVPVEDYIAPASGRYNPGQSNKGNLGFYVIGPQRAFPFEAGADPTPPVATFSSPYMSYKSTPADRTTGTKRPDDPGNRPTVVLQRLANPYLAYDDIQNPYVTIDFLENIKPNNALTQAQDPNFYVAIEKRTSWGKRDPFDSLSNANNSHLREEGVDKNGMGTPLLPQPNKNQPQHTFFRHNGQQLTGPKVGLNGQPQDGILSPAFTWLPHPDRQLISPMELLTVSAYKPAHLTQRFPVVLGNTDYRHFAPWLIDSPTNPNRLFRFFEFVETHSWATGVARGGRTPGLINLNTVWDPETLMALCDPQPGNDFVDTDIYKPLSQDSATAPQSIFWRLMKSRTPGLLAGQGPSYLDQPFLGNAPGVAPKGDVQHPLRATGIGDSFLRLDNFGGPGPLFQTYNSKTGQTGVAHYDYYNKNQILYKLFNNVTTRSNVFAVWVTVGFFQVTDDTARPVKLGAEIGKAENRNIRHRMFAIVDRSNLTIDTDPTTNNPGPPIFLEGNLETLLPDPAHPTDPPTVPVLSIAGAQLSGGALIGSYEGIPWKIQKGSWLQTEPRAAAPTAPVDVQVVSVNPPADPTKQPPTITLGPGSLGTSATISSPMYLMPMNVPASSGTGPAKEFTLGNPGPKPGFNPRNYPWIVRYFSIIN